MGYLAGILKNGKQGHKLIRKEISNNRSKFTSRE
jgi:hypothetical protein